MIKADSQEKPRAGVSLFPLYGLIWGSGFSALVYQTVWFREFRHIFGCSTVATAAVMAIFMGGLGFGSLFLGKKADRSAFPLGLYARLELGVAVLAALSPWLIDFTRWGYIQLCISVNPALHTKTFFRLLLALIVLAPPTFLMGGTLPAIVKAAIREKDISRVSVAVLYGCNTIGAVFGVFLGTFYLFEFWGFRKTLWLAAVLNLLVAWAAFRLSPDFPSQETSEENEVAPSAPQNLVYWSAFLCGFSFFLMEIVWFRMLSPLMCGTTYSFGHILGIALLGIGIGGLIFQFRLTQEPATPFSFALSTGIQGLFLAFSFVLGDSIAILTWVMNYFGVLGFGGRVLSWTIIGLIMIFPSAVVAGYQFPLLISLLGRGKKNVGGQVGRAYAWNTAGSIAGSLLGGFVLLPGFSAPGCWRFATLILLVTGMGWAVWSWGKEPNRFVYCFPIFLGLAGISLLSWSGPTAFFRHGSVAFRTQTNPKTINQILNTVNSVRRTVKEEFEGIESVFSLKISDGVSFMVNGKSDGNSIRDGETMIMVGLLSALFHPNPKKAFVVGLGTGCTSGALGMVASMEKVVTAEIEPKIVEVASKCRDVNFAVLENPKIVNIFADGREVLLTATESFDIIVSEPSNPHRAGVSSLFTREFYRTVRNRLAPGGIFTQWVQTYNIDPETYSSILATLFSVFPYIETWQTRAGGDAFLLCSIEPITWNIDRLRARIGVEPFRSVLASTWLSYDLEGFLAKFVCSTPAGKKMAQEKGRINLDDWPHIEYGFAKNVGRISGNLIDLQTTAGMFDPEIFPFPIDQIDWAKVEQNRLLSFSLNGYNYLVGQNTDKNLIYSKSAQEAWRKRSFSKARNFWNLCGEKPKQPIELMMYCEAFAQVADHRILPLLETLPADREIEKLTIVAQYHFQLGEYSRSRDALIKAFQLHRLYPWPMRQFIDRAMELCLELVRKDRTLAQPLFESLSLPFCQNAVDEQRHRVLLYLAKSLPNEIMFKEFQKADPNPFWEEELLVLRYNCYKTVSLELGERASKAVRKYYDSIPPKLSQFCLTHFEGIK